MILQQVLGAVASKDYRKLEYQISGNRVEFVMPLREAEANIYIFSLTVSEDSVELYRPGRKDCYVKWSVNDPELCEHIKEWMKLNVSDFIDLAETLW